VVEARPRPAVAGRVIPVAVVALAGLAVVAQADLVAVEPDRFAVGLRMRRSPATVRLSAWGI
jgi:hypothetical protein